MIIGAMKAGTTSLHDYLSKHPDVFMSVQKELDFFVEQKNWKLGIDWYKKQFPVSTIAIGESSPNYTKSLIFGNVPDKIKSILPDVKLIYILRDPIKRLVSHYSHQYIDRREFDQLIRLFRICKQVIMWMHLCMVSSLLST
ncbi:MAG: sulfotransferase domain-containing protein [Cyclobacteriaceae bacterium]